MHNILTVAVVERHKNHFECFSSQLLVEIFIFYDSFKKFTTFTKLRHQVHIVILLEVLVKLDHIGMILKQNQLSRRGTYKLLKDSNFCLKSVPVLDLAAGDQFDSTYGTCVTMLTPTNNTIGSFSDFLHRD